MDGASMSHGMRWPSENAVLGTTAKISASTRVDAVGGAECRINLPTPLPQPTKFSNVPTDGEASKRQAKRLSELRLMNEAGVIRGLCRQPEYVLIPKQVRECGELIERKLSYIPDFLYEEWTSNGWRMVVEDSKGHATPGYIQKRKLMLRIHGIEIRET